MPILIRRKNQNRFPSKFKEFRKKLDRKGTQNNRNNKCKSRGNWKIKKQLFD